MPEPVRVTLFGEDAAHEAAGRTYVERVASDLGIRFVMSVASSRGGAGRALNELGAFRRTASNGILIEGLPDVLVVLLDGNRVGRAVRKQEIRECVGRDGETFPYVVAGCPEPHIERWLFIDSRALRSVVGVAGRTPAKRADREQYKEAFRTLVERAGHPTTQDPAVEFAPEIIEQQRLPTAAQADASFREFLRDLRAALRAAAR